MKRNVGLGFGRPLSIRISHLLATALDDQRQRITTEVGTNVSASDVVRRAVEEYLIEAGFEIPMTPWPSPPNLENKVKQLEAEIDRLRRLVPEPSTERSKVPFFE